MRTNNRIKAAFIAGIIALMMLFMYSCESNDVYSLVERFISGESTAFDIEGDLLINIDYLIKNGIIEESDKESIPSQIHINLKGVIEKPKVFYVNLTIDGKFSTYICCNKDKLYFEISESAYIAVEFLKIIKIADVDALNFFEDAIMPDDEGTISEARYISFDVSKFTLGKFKSYFDYCGKFITFKSTSVEFDNKGYKITFPSYSGKREIEYEDIAEEVKARLSTLAKNRSDMITVIFSGNENGSYIDIASVKNNKSTVYPTKQLDCDINAFKDDKSAVVGENIIPFRYFMETAGYAVGYNEKTKKAYFINDLGKEVYVDGVIIKGKTYISVLELMIKNFKLNVKSVGEYVEMEIYLD